MAIIGQFPFATRDAKFAMKWVRHRCHEAPSKTVAMAALIPP